MTIYAVTNRKGGVAKTTTSINVGAALASMGKRVLLIDLDASGDLTTHAGIDLQDGDNTIFEVLTEHVPIKDAIKRVEREATRTSYDIVPADDAMNNLTVALSNIDNPQTRLRDALAQVSNDYDIVILDTPPTIGIATVQALTAADAAVVPAAPNYLSLEAITALASVVNDIRVQLNPNLHIGGVVLTGYNPRSTHQKEIRKAIAEAMPDILYPTEISSGIAVAEAAANGTDIFEYTATTPRRKHSRALDQFRKLATEIIEREAQNGKN